MHGKHIIGRHFKVDKLTKTDIFDIAEKVSKEYEKKMVGENDGVGSLLI